MPPAVRIRFAALACLLPAALVAQVPPDLAAERSEFARWLLTAANSPFAAQYHQPLQGDLILGAGSDPALAALPPGTLSEGAIQVRLVTPAGNRVLPRNRDVALGDYRIRVGGARGRSVVTIFGAVRNPREPEYHAWRSDAVVEGVLEPPAQPEERRMLGLDGIEINGSLAGTFVATLGGAPLRLTVYRMNEPGSEESELQIFFRDGTNAATTYPAGRFLALRPLGGNRWRADFNRSRNPFCAYSTVFPCPLPWTGNAVDARIEAGEIYRRAAQ